MPEMEDRFRSMFEQAGDAFYLSTLDGKILDVNQRACDSLGYTSDELLSSTLTEIDHDPQHEEPFWGNLTAGHPITVQRTYQRKDGSLFPVEVCLTLVEFDRESLVLSLVRDITERKPAEMAIIESKDPNCGPIESITGKEEPKASQWLGQRTDPAATDFDNASFEELVDVEALQAIMESFYEITGLPSALLSIKEDVLVAVGWQEICTRFHRVHPDTCARCRESDAYIKTHLPDEGGVLYRCANGLLDMAVPIRIRNRHIATFFFGQVSLAEEPVDREFFRQQAHRFDFDEVEYLAALEKVPVVSRVKLRAIVDFSRQLVDLIATMGMKNLLQAKAIIERQQVQREREELIVNLEAKNAELERFTYTVSHDLRTPLITIKGFAGMLQEDLASGDREAVEDDLDRIGAAADRMNQLLSELLELSRIGRLANPSEKVSLKELAYEVLDLLQGELEQRSVQVDIAPNLPEFVGDRLRLFEVVQNLLENSLKYMGDQPHPRIEIGCRIEEGETIAYVRDNGLGIEPQYQHKIFGLFEQLDQSTEGSGVGLALVKRIIEVHRGRIWVESEGTGRGSTFCFTVPSDNVRSSPQNADA